MSFITLRALLFVAECLLASILLPLLAYAATRLVHRAALRHLVWLTMFGVLAVLPLAALLLPANQIVLTEPAPVAAAAPMESIIALPLVETKARLPEAPGEKRVAALDFKVDPTPAPVMAVPAPVPVPVTEPRLTPENALLLLVLLWAAGLCWNLARMALGAIGLRRIRLQSQIFSVAGAPCEVRLSPQAGGPATLGVFRAMVLLPETARHWSAARLQAVLAHEGAHVRRHDIASQTLARLVCAVFWFNPLLWLAARALRREAEFAADDAVLAGGMTASSYAAELVALASEIVTPVRRLPAPSAGMADSALMTRVQSVLAANASRRGVTGMDVARTLSLGLAATLLLGTARVDLAMAQDKPAGPAPAVQAAPVDKPAPAAPPARSASPKVDIEAAPRVDVEVEALKARAEAAAAEARQVDAMAIAATQALAAVEQARKAAQALADMQVQRAMAQTGSSENAIAAARSLAAIEQAENAAKAVASDRVGEAMRQRMAQAVQQAKEAQQSAREAEQRALEAKAQADEALRRLERQMQSLLAPLSDEEKADLAAARQLKITVSPVEVNERMRAIGNALGLKQTDQLRDRMIVGLAREKMAALQTAMQKNVVVTPADVDERIRSYMAQNNLTQAPADLRPRVEMEVFREKMAALQAADAARIYRVYEIFLAVDRPENDAKVWAELEAIEQRIRGGGSFRDLARQHSQHPTAKLGGDKGWATAEQLDAELAGVVTALKVGELSRPVRGRGGWYLLGLQDTRAVALPAQADSISLAPGEVQTITFPRPVGNLNVSNPGIVDITIVDARRAFLLGKSYGSTNIIALGPDGESVSNTQVRVLSRPQEEQRAPETQQGAVEAARNSTWPGSMNGGRVCRRA